MEVRVREPRKWLDTSLGVLVCLGHCDWLLHTPSYFVSVCAYSHLTSPHLTSPHLTSPHLTSPRLTSCARATVFRKWRASLPKTLMIEESCNCAILCCTPLSTLGTLRFDWSLRASVLCSCVCIHAALWKPTNEDRAGCMNGHIHTYRIIHSYIDTNKQTNKHTYIHSRIHSYARVTNRI